MEQRGQVFSILDSGDTALVRRQKESSDRSSTTFTVCRLHRTSMIVLLFNVENKMYLA